MANSDQSLYSGMNQIRYNQVSNELEGTSGSPDWTPLSLSIVSDITLANGKILVGNASNQAAAVSLSGDATIINTGALTIANLAVTAAKIANTTITNAQISASAAIVYSKLSLTGGIVNADINASAAIAYAKLAALTVSRALVSDGSGVVSVATTTSTEIGYVNGVTSSIQAQLGTKVDTAGRDISISGTTAKVQPSVQTATASGGNITATSDTKSVVVVTVDANATALAPSGTPANGQSLKFILHNDGSHAITFDTGGSGKFRFGATIASYTATASKTDYIGALWNATDSRWDIVSASLGF